MAARKNLAHSELVRTRIRTTALVNRLTAHCMGKLKVPLDATQVNGIGILLRKALPDLQAIELSGEIEQRVKQVSAEPPTEAEWSRMYGSEQPPRLDG